MAEPQVLKFPQGVDNRDREYALPEGTLRSAVNLDVTRDGGLMSRKGLREVLSGECHSLYTPPHGRFLLFVQDGVMQRLDDDDTTQALVAVNGPVVYTSLNDDVFWTDGSTVGRVRWDGEADVWGLNTPPLPLVSASSDGGLPAGTYQVAMTALTTAGLESGAGEAVEVEVSEGGGITVTTPSASGVRFAIYRTSANGGKEELRRAIVMNPATMATLGVSALGAVLASLFVVRPPPGHCLIAHKGRLWCASGKPVWFTSEQLPHWVQPTTGY